MAEKGEKSDITESEENYIKTLNVLSILLLIALSIIFMVTYQIVPLVHSDAGYEFHSTLKIVNNHELESGPFIAKVIYAIFFIIIGPNIIILKIVDLISTILLLYLLWELFLPLEDHNNKGITKIKYEIRFLAILFLYSMLFLLSWGVYSGKHYPLYLVFVILGINSFKRSFNKKSVINKNNKSWIYLKNEYNYTFISGIFIGMSLLTHTMATPLVIFPLVFIILNLIANKLERDSLKFKHELHIVASFLIGWGIISMPYLTWRFILDKELFLNYPNTWGSIKYGRQINEQFWKHPKPFTKEYYERIIIIIGYVLINPLFIIFFILGIIQLFINFSKSDFDKKTDLLFLSWLMSNATMILASRIPTNFQYFYPYIPIVAWFNARGFYYITVKTHQLVVKVKIKRGHLDSNTIINLKRRKEKEMMKTLFLIYLLFSLSFTVLIAMKQTNQIDQRITPYKEDLIEFNNRVNTTNKTFLHRSYIIQPYLPRANVLQITSDLNERDAITFLNWTSDIEIMKIIIKYKIDYVVLIRDKNFEENYYVFFVNQYGYKPRHYESITKTSLFQLVFLGQVFLFYSVNHSRILEYI